MLSVLSLSCSGAEGQQPCISIIIRGSGSRVRHVHELPANGLTGKARAQFAVLEVAIETIDGRQTDGDHQRRAVLHGKAGWRAVAVD